MIDHLTLRVHDLAASKAFYVIALKPLGYELLMEFPDSAGFGAGGKPDLWLAPDTSAAPQHVAFAAPSRAAVDAFHAAGLAVGGKDNGAPGLRVHYHPSYYGAFVDDPTGHHIEAVIHTRPAAGRQAGAGSPGKKAAGTKASRKAARRAAPRKAVRRPASRKAARRPAAGKTARGARR